MLMPWKLKFPNFNQLRLMQIVLLNVCLLDSLSLWKCSAHKHTGRSFQLPSCLVIIAFHTVLILYFLKEIIKTNPGRSPVGFSLLLSSLF